MYSNVQAAGASAVNNANLKAPTDLKTMVNNSIKN